MLGGVQVGHRLHKAQIATEGVFDKILAITGDGAALDVDPVAAQGVDLVQLLPDNGHRVALIGVVIGVEQAAVRGDQSQLGGGAARINAQIGVALIGGGVHHRGAVFRVVVASRLSSSSFRALSKGMES